LGFANPDGHGTQCAGKECAALKHGGSPSEAKSGTILTWADVPALRLGWIMPRLSSGIRAQPLSFELRTN
jgi:hypothetical protein